MSIRAVWAGVVLWGMLVGAACAAGSTLIYPEVVAGRPMEFPRDEGSHPAFRTEWWYITGWLEDEQGAPRGFQVTFFRSRPGVDEANPSRFAAKQVLFAHAAISDPRVGRLLRDERAAREGFGLASAREGDLAIAIDDWWLRRTATHVYRTEVAGAGFALQLELRATSPPLLQGQRGFSQKGPDRRSASYYYSQPQLRVSGQLVVGERRHRVRGSAWLDHEWSSSLMDEQAQGWDWLGVNLDGGGALMAFRMRTAAGTQHWAAATVSSAVSEGSGTGGSGGDASGTNDTGANGIGTNSTRANGTRANGASNADIGRTARSFSPDEVEWTALRRWRSPRTGIEYPVEWLVRVGDRKLRVRPLMDDQENDASASTGTVYWEGAVRVYDERERPLGRGYLELTGYGGRVRL